MNSTETLKGKLSALAGPERRGQIQPDERHPARAGPARSARSASSTTKGKHTTNFRQLHPLIGGGWVADAPGWKSLALWDTEPEEIDAYFPELAPLVEDCQFSDCSHIARTGLRRAGGGQKRQRCGRNAMIRTCG